MIKEKITIIIFILSPYYSVANVSNNSEFCKGISLFCDRKKAYPLNTNLYRKIPIGRVKAAQRPK